MIRKAISVSASKTGAIIAFDDGSVWNWSLYEWEPVYVPEGTYLTYNEYLEFDPRSDMTYAQAKAVKDAL